MKHLLKHLLLLCLLFMLGIGARATVYSGTFWSLDTSTGELKITGNTDDYYKPEKVPWYNNKSYITKVTIKPAVTFIGRCAFNGCFNLKNLNIEDSSTELQICTPYDGCTGCDDWNYDGVFDGCPLETIYLGRKYVSRRDSGSEGSSYKDALTATERGQGDTHVSHVWKITLGAYASLDNFLIFSKYPNLTSVSISNNSNFSILNDGIYNSNKTILYKVMPYKSSDYFQVPNTVTQIYEKAFEGCSKITGIQLGSNLSQIGKYAFENCTGLTSITCEATTPPTCSDYCFYNIPSFPILYVPYGTSDAYKTPIGWNLFSNIVEMEQIDITTIPNNTIYYTTSDGLICSPYRTGTDIFGANIISNTYQNGQGIITFDNNVTSIGRYALSGCSKLTSIIIPNSVINIEQFAFDDCSGLTSINIPNSETDILYGAFSGCFNLKKVSINSNVVIAKSYDYSEDETIARVFGSQVEEYILGEGVTSIGNHVFYECENLRSVTISNSVTSIGESAFSHCSGLTSITVDAQNEYYDSRDDCNALIDTKSNTLILGCNNTIIPNSVTGIGNSAFFGCSGLTFITIPESVTSIGEHAFCGCSGLTSVNIPNSVTNIERGAFRDCSGLTSVNIPESVTSIGGLAFCGCSGLTSVNIPESVTRIGLEAFYGCSGLTSITCKASTPPTCVGDCFQYVPSSAILYVPYGTSDAYKNKNDWKNFSNIEELAPENVLCTSITLLSEAETLTVGDTKTLIATILPDNATDKSVTWSSDNESVATVVDGVVTAVAAGTATITATTADGSNVSDACVVTVTTKDSGADTPASGYVFTLDPVSTTAGEEVELSINMTNEELINGFQFDITLPEGIDVKKNAKGKYVFQIGERGDDHTFSSQKLSNGSIRVVCTSLENTEFTGNEGQICIIPLTIGSAIINGTYDVKLTNISLSDLESNDIIVPDAEGQITVLNDYLTVGTAEALAGKTFTMGVGMTNKSSDICGLQFDVTMPEGISIAKDANGKYAIGISSRGDDHIFSTTDLDGNTVRVVCTSLTNSAFTGTEGTLCEITFSADKAMEAGEYEIALTNVIASNTAAVDIPMPDASGTVTMKTYTPGDVNDNGSITVADVTAAISFVLGTQQSSFIFEAADMDGNGIVKVNDVTSVINLVLAQGTGAKARSARFAARKTASVDTPKLYAEAFAIEPGDTKDVSIMLDNPETEANGWQADIKLPEGLSFALNAKGKYVTAIDYDRTDGYSITSQLQTDGSVRVVGVNMNNDAIWDTSGKIMTIRVKADDNLTAGVYDISLSNVSLSDMASNDVVLSDSKCSALSGDLSSAKTLTLYGGWTEDAMNDLNGKISGNTAITSVDMGEASYVADAAVSAGNKNTLFYIPEGMGIANTENVVCGGVCESLALTDGYSFCAPQAFKAETASYTATVSSSLGYKTLMLPYSCSVPAVFEAYGVSSVTGSVLNMTSISSIPANTPVILKNAATADMYATNVDVAATETSQYADGVLTGTYEAMNAPVGSYVLQNQGGDVMFYLVTEDVQPKVNPFRAYLAQAGGSAKAFSVNFEDATSIRGIESDAVESDIYTLDGLRSTMPVNGVNIVRSKDGKVKKFIK